MEQPTPLTTAGIRAGVPRVPRETPADSTEEGLVPWPWASTRTLQVFTQCAKADP